MQPIVYEVDLFVDEEIAGEFQEWLLTHRDEMLGIDGFLGAAVLRRELLDEDAESGQTRLTVQYRLRDRPAFENYVAEHAPRMREQGQQRFGERFSARRSLLETAGEGSKDSLYSRLGRDLRALLEGERDFLANMANCSALLYERIPGINWVGFYLRRGEQLILGPFQGAPACVRVDWGKGVCGTAAERGEILIVDDVHAFDGHIACDPRSRSEIVVPLREGAKVIGVLDLDSPLFAHFDEVDRRGLSAVAAILLDASDPEKYA